MNTQEIKNQTANFPRVTRDDYFNLEPKMKVAFPDSNNYKEQIQQPIPMFDSIASNFPFIQQEDIPNDVLTTFFRGKFVAKHVGVPILIHDMSDDIAQMSKFLKNGNT